MYDPGTSAWSRAPLPSNLMAETALLGACLVANKSLDRCKSLAPVHFYGDRHGELFKAIQDGVALGRVVDAVSLKDRFDRRLLGSLLAAFIGHEPVSEYARVIVDTWRARELLQIAYSVIDDTAKRDRSAEEIAMEVAGKIDRISHGRAAENIVTLDDAIAGVIADLSKPDRIAGISSGFRCIDRRLGGLEPGLVYVLAGRPGMGKSSIAHQICINAARSGVGVLELSLEMSAAQLGRRALSTASRIPIMAIKRNDLTIQTAERLHQAQQELRGLPLMIDDAGGQTPAMIAVKAREARRRHGLGLLMIDHLNLMRPEDADAKHGGTWAVGRASNAVLSIAKDCGVPVILCVQLNRGVEAREDKRPNLSDLRQSGDIEQDAYAVGFIYRREYYLRHEIEKRPDESANKFAEREAAHNEARLMSAGRAELVWAKVRDGEPGIDPLLFHGPTATFSEEGEI